MKKLVNIFFACLFVLVTAFSAIACDDNEGGSKDPGVYASRINGVFTLTQYVDDGTTTDLDLGEAVFNKYGEELGRIKAGAFDGNATIQKLIVPTSVTEIDGGAFRGMTALTEITLPFVGASVNADAFSSETDGAADKAVDAERNFGYVFASNRYEGGAVITQKYNSGSESSATYYIPYTLRKVIVKPNLNYKVPMYAFNGLTQISTIELSASVVGLGDFSFANSTVQNLKVGLEYSNLILGTDWDKDASSVLTITDVNGIVER